MVRHILRDAALPITWLFLHTNITANQMTLIAILTGLLGIFCCALSGGGWFLTGMLLLQFWYLLDHVDGQIARYYKSDSMTGRFFDYLMHHLIHGGFFFGLACYLFIKTESFALFLWGALSAFSVLFFNLIYDIQYKTFFEQIGIRKTLSLKAPEATNATEIPRGQLHASLFKRGFSFCHKLIEMHVAMNLFTVSALLDFFMEGLETRFFLVMIYSFIAPFCCLIKYAYWIKTKQVDTQFSSIIN